MNQDQAKEQLENLRRYEAIRREQLGTAINLILGLAAAGVAFCLSRMTDKDARFSAPGNSYFLIAISLLVGAVGLGIGATFTRLCDFRLTAKKLRRRLRRAPASELSKLGKYTTALGVWTWGFLHFNLPYFAVALCSWLGRCGCSIGITFILPLKAHSQPLKEPARLS